MSLLQVTKAKDFSITVKCQACGDSINWDGFGTPPMLCKKCLLSIKRAKDKHERRVEVDNILIRIDEQIKKTEYGYLRELFKDIKKVLKDY